MYRKLVGRHANSTAVETPNKQRDYSGPSTIYSQNTNYNRILLTANEENEDESPFPFYKTKLCTAVHTLLGRACTTGLQQQLLELDRLRHFI